MTQFMGDRKALANGCMIRVDPNDDFFGPPEQEARQIALLAFPKNSSPTAAGYPTDWDRRFLHLEFRQ
jgi:hypothetical protein